MQKEFKLNPSSILLKQHKLKELKRIYTELNGEPPKSEKGYLQLVKEISDQATVSDLIATWPDKLFAHNTSIKIYEVSNSLNNELIKNGIQSIKGHFNDEAWNKLLGQGYSPKELAPNGNLLHVSNIDQKWYFLFTFPGRSKEVIEELSVRYLVQPQFTVAVWDNQSAVLEVRGMEKRNAIISKFFEYFARSEQVLPHFEQLRIEDRDGAKALTVALGGVANRGKFVNRDQDISEVTMVAQADVELYETEKVQQLEEEDYEQDSAGIDFVWNGGSYTVWVGFKTGSFWIRSGEVTEDLISYIQERIISLWT